MKNKFLIFFFSFYCFSSIIAQNNLNENELELIQLALEKSFSIKKATKELSIDSLERKIILQNFIPTLELDTRYGYGGGNISLDVPTVELPLTGIELNEKPGKFDYQGQVFSTDLTLKALIFSGLEVKYGAKATEEIIKANNAMLEVDKSDVIKDMIDTFNDIELLKRSEILITKSEERLAKEKERVKKAIEIGLAIPYDRDKITAAELSLASVKVELYGNLNLLYSKLAMITDVDVSTLETYDYNLDPWVLEQHNKTALDRPELSALESSIKAYDYNLKIAKNAFLPKIMAEGSFSYASLFNANLQTPYALPGKSDINLEINNLEIFPKYFVGVGMNWELFSGLKNGSEIKIARLEKSIVEEEKNDVKKMLTLFAKKTNVDFDVKNKQLQFKSKEMQVAENNLNSAINSYREGLISITDRLQSETEYQTVALNYYKMIAEQRMAALEVLISTGSLQLENLKN